MSFIEDSTEFIKNIFLGVSEIGNNSKSHAFYVQESEF